MTKLRNCGHGHVQALERILGTEVLRIGDVNQFHYEAILPMVLALAVRLDPGPLVRRLQAWRREYHPDERPGTVSLTCHWRCGFLSTRIPIEEP